MHNHALVAAVFTLPLRIPHCEVVATNPDTRVFGDVRRVDLCVFVGVDHGRGGRGLGEHVGGG